jgi:hypothetical protein
MALSRNGRQIRAGTRFRPVRCLMILKEVLQDIAARGAVLSESTEKQDLEEKADGK